MAAPEFKLGIQDYFGPFCSFFWFLGGLWLISMLVIRPFYVEAEEVRPVRAFYFRRKKKGVKSKESSQKSKKSKAAAKNMDESSKSNKSKKSSKESKVESKATNGSKNSAAPRSHSESETN